ncbi:MAG: class I tRNA ligase family protein, partial [Oscillospiraceae bacterium]|nr:class I tRNA ligase family protein [Oscillospiraceae bacterium]
EVADAKKEIVGWLSEKGLGETKVNYRLRDWVFARQRYWGEPIPIVHCPVCGMVALPEEQLPLTLPQVESYEPTESGESPLHNIREWVETVCPRCGAAAERETDTMPQWAGSSWYFLRYADPKNHNELASADALKYWTPVDWYNGGMEHTTLHLLYSRFWHKFLYDIGVVPTPEPYKRRTSQGVILGEDGFKMAKSRGNTVDPNDIVKLYGADTMRLYIMFIGDFEKTATWSSQAVKGCRRFVERVWALAEGARTGGVKLSAKSETLMHKTIKKVGEDIESLKFNTAIAAMMTLVNELTASGASKGDMSVLLRLLSPFAPHVADELWERLGFDGFCCGQAWPSYDPAKTLDAEVEMAVQVSGRLRSSIKIALNSEDGDVVAAAMSDPKVKPHIEGKTMVKTIVVKNKLVNLVVK